MYISSCSNASSHLIKRIRNIHPEKNNYNNKELYDKLKQKLRPSLSAYLFIHWKVNKHGAFLLYIITKQQNEISYSHMQ